MTTVLSLRNTVAAAPSWSFPLTSDIILANALSQSLIQSGNSYGVVRRSLVYPMTDLRRTCINCGQEFVKPLRLAATENAVCSPCDRVIEFYTDYDNFDEFDIEDAAAYFDPLADEDQLEGLTNVSYNEGEEDNPY